MADTKRIIHQTIDIRLTSDQIGTSTNVFANLLRRSFELTAEPDATKPASLILKQLKILKTLIASSSLNFITHKRNLSAVSSRVHRTLNTKKNQKCCSKMVSSIKHPLMERVLSDTSLDLSST